jgi:hypothetical protein
MTPQWNSFWQSVAVAGLLTSIGTFLKMYHLVGIQAEQIQTLRSEIKDERERNDKQDTRHIAAEVMLARIDANVVELLQLRRQENRRDNG